MAKINQKITKITIDDLAAMFARNFDKTDKKLNELGQDIKDVKKILIFGRHEERIANLEVDMKETKKILQFK